MFGLYVIQIVCGLVRLLTVGPLTKVPLNGPPHNDTACKSIESTSLIGIQTVITESCGVVINVSGTLGLSFIEQTLIIHEAVSQSFGHCKLQTV